MSEFTGKRGLDNKAIGIMISRLIWGRLAYKILYAIYKVVKRKYYDPKMGVTPKEEPFYEIKEDWLLERMTALGIENKPPVKEEKSVEEVKLKDE